MPKKALARPGRMKTIALVGACALVFQALAVARAYAWNEPGHRVIAAAAVSKMSPELRQRVVEVLQAHPRYKEDLAAYRPKRLRGLTDIQWLLGQAAQWPDHARSFDNAPSYRRGTLVERYHRGRWHYVNVPIYLALSDKSLDIKDPRLSAELRPDGKTNQPIDVLTALHFMRGALLSPKTSEADKGLWVSWALHLIADAHQPLHTTAMFSANRWPRGDRGGNEVKIAGSGRSGRLDSLHYFWDSAITNRRRPREIAALAQTLEELTIDGADEHHLEPVEWIGEGHRLAQTLVYQPLRSQLVGSPVVTISSDYTRRVHASALRRASLAAHRTAAWLQAALLGTPADTLE